MIPKSITFPTQICLARTPSTICTRVRLNPKNIRSRVQKIINMLLGTFDNTVMRIMFLKIRELILYAAISQPPRVFAPPLRSDRRPCHGCHQLRRRVQPAPAGTNVCPRPTPRTLADKLCRRRHLLTLRMSRNPHRRPNDPPRRSLPVETYSLFGQNEDETESDEEERPPTTRQRARKKERAEAGWRRVVLRMGFTLTQLSRSRVLSRWKEVQAEVESAAQPSAPTTTAQKPRNGQAPRRDDLTFVGLPLRPSTARQWPLASGECPHTQYLQAGGGRRGPTAMFWWTCLGCGARWERVGEAAATDGTATRPLRETSNVRVAPLRPKAAAKPKAVAKGTDLPIVPEAMAIEEFEVVPTLDRQAFLDHHSLISVGAAAEQL